MKNIITAIVNVLSIVFEEASNVAKETVEVVSNGYNKLRWSFNLPVEADVDLEAIEYTDGTDEKGVWAPMTVIEELVNAERKAQEAIDSARQNAVKKFEELSAWEETELAYKAAKKNLFEQGIRNVPMEEINHGKELIELRNKASELDELYANSQKDYWNIIPMNETRFYGNRFLGNSIPTPVLPEGHPFRNTYWEEMRLLLPAWVVKELQAEGNRKAAAEKFFTRTNGTWCHQLNEDRTKDIEEKEPSEEFFDALLKEVRFFLGEIDIRELDKSPKALLNELHRLVLEGEINPYAVAYRLVYFIYSGDMDLNDLSTVCNLTADEANSFFELYENGVKENARQRNNNIIDNFVGEWYSLSFKANITEEERMMLLKEGMFANLNNPNGFKLTLGKATSVADLWSRYSKRINISAKKNPALKAVDIMRLSSHFNEVEEAAFNRLQENTYVLKTLAKSGEMVIATDNPRWDYLLNTVREALADVTNPLAKAIAANPRMIRGGGSTNDYDDYVIDAAKTKAAWDVFNIYSQMVIDCFGIEWEDK